MLPALRMGKYVIDGLLGPGSVTETYLTHVEGDSRPNAAARLYALKLLRRDRVPEKRWAEAVVRFLSAGQQLRDFHRAGFCPIVDMSDDPAAIFIVAEYVVGRDLGRLLEACQSEGKQGLHPALVGLIGSEIARLLHVGYSAKPPFFHLGLRPQNVILSPAGEVVLLDAGVSASLRGITEQAPERWALVAPELQGIDTGKAALSERAAMAADLYALGALLMLLLTGSAPSPVAGGDAPVEVPEIPGLTGKLASALRRLLSRKPEDRPEDAATLVEWLAGEAAAARQRQQLIAKAVGAIDNGIRLSSPNLLALASEPPSGVPPSQLQPAATTAQGLARSGTARRLVPASLLVAVAAAVVLGLIGVFWSHTVPDSQTTADGVRQPNHLEEPQARHARAAPKEPQTANRQQAEGAGEDNALLARVAGHLVVETVPPGATVWVDGLPRGSTFVEIPVGEGKHDVVLIAAGHRMFRELIDTSRGAIVRRTLIEVAAPSSGDGYVEVSCRTAGRFPILLDQEETGLLCPVRRLPAKSGRHTVGIFVPHERQVVSAETNVRAGSNPASVAFSQ